jgi:hypothetical protein
LNTQGFNISFLGRLKAWDCAATILFFLIYLQDVNTHTSVPDSTKIVPGQPIFCRTLAVRGGHSATSSGDGRYSSEKIAQKKKTLQQQPF